MRVMVRNDNYPGHNKDLIERLNQQYGYAKDVKEYFDLKQIDERDSVRQLYYVLENKGSIISVVGKTTVEIIELFECRQKVP